MNAVDFGRRYSLPRDLAGVGYVADFVGRMLLPDYSEFGIASYLRAPRVSEILVCFWLLLFGARRSLWPPKTPRARTMP